MASCPLSGYCTADCPGSANCTKSTRAAALAAAAASAAKKAVGWKRILLAVLAVAAAVASAFLFTGCVADFSQTAGGTAFHLAVAPLEK